MDLVDIRKDQECLDKVGVHLKLDDAGRAQFYVTVGDEVQTLTRAMASILCEGLAGTRALSVPDLPATFVPRIVGQKLFRQRSHTVYYILTRMKAAVKAWDNARRRAALEPSATGNET
jgi:cysteine desulfuration protein SufE